MIVICTWRLRCNDCVWIVERRNCATYGSRLICKIAKYPLKNETSSVQRHRSGTVELRVHSPEQRRVRRQRSASWTRRLRSRRCGI